MVTEYEHHQMANDEGDRTLSSLAAASPSSAGDPADYHRSLSLCHMAYCLVVNSRSSAINDTVSRNVTSSAARNFTDRLLHTLAFNSDVTKSALPCSEPFRVDHDELTSASPAVLFGILAPAAVLAALLTNLLVCAVLCRPDMRTATNCILVAMAIADSLTGLLPLPTFVYFYTLGHYRDWVPYAWCQPYHFLADYLPTVSHTASVWLIVLLSGERFLCVCYPLIAKRWCTIPKVLRAIGLIWTVALLSQLCRFIERRFEHLDLPSCIEPVHIMTACTDHWAGLVPLLGEDVYFNLYFWCRLLFIHLLPCSALVVFNIFLISALSRTNTARRHLLGVGGNRGESVRGGVGEGMGAVHRDTHSTTLMLVIVVCVFLIVEVPSAISLLLVTLENTLDIGRQIRNNHILGVVINLSILLSYPVNFFIYCAMSSQFRYQFVRMWCSRVHGHSTNGHGHGRDNRQSLSTFRTRCGSSPETTRLMAKAVAKDSDLGTKAHVESSL